MSRTELELSREELKKSANALTAQNKAIELQSFEQTFFSWLNNYRTLIESVTYQKSKDLNTIGRTALLELWKNYIHHLSWLDSLVGDKREFDEIEVMGKWEELYDENKHQLDNCFRTLYRLIVWVDTQNSEKISQEQKWLYISILRSQLSWIEMVFIYCNGMTERGFKFRSVIEKYALFDNLTFSDQYISLLKENLIYPKGFSDTAYSSELAKIKLNLHG